MTIAECDNCGKVRPGASGEAYGVEGFFCHICRGDELDPFGEIGDSRRDEQLRIQALGAAISRRDWWSVEAAYSNIRDAFDQKPQQ
jgi:hypothetical protein